MHYFSKYLKCLNAVVLNLWSADICLMVHEQKGISLISKDINTQTDQFWQFSMVQFIVVVRD